MPGHDLIEAVVELDVRIDGVQADCVAELAQPRDRLDSLARGEVVEDGLGHEQIGRADAVLRLDRGHPECGIEREVDVVPKVDLPTLRPAPERGEAVATGLSRLEDLGVVPQVERAAHAAVSTSTTSFEAALSARLTASSGVSAIAIT